MFVRTIVILVFVSVQLLLNGCVSSIKMLEESQEFPAAQEALENAAVTAVLAEEDSSDEVEYSQAGVLRAGLLIKVVVFVSGDSEINEDCRISKNGYISLPLVGRCPVAGTTVEELTHALEELYSKRYFVNPTVDVSFIMDKRTVDLSPWGCVTVLGRVKNPGRVRMPATRDMTVTHAIQSAGGFASSAKQTAISVTRRKNDGAREKFKVNLDRVGAKENAEEDMVLMHGDVIYVFETIF